MAANDACEVAAQRGLRRGVLEGLDVAHGISETQFEIGGERPVRQSQARAGTSSRRD